MEQILIVEDDLRLNQGLCKALKSENRKIISCMDLKSAREQLEIDDVSLILLDINLPDGNGLNFLKELKELKEENSIRPVILLTANDTDMDIVEGLEQGADDYITKPFSLAVLRARVNTQLRKNAANLKNENGKNEKIFKIDYFEFNFDKMVFLAGGENIELSKTEQKLLKILVEHQGGTVSRNMLIDYIWTDGAKYVDENALSVSVKRLRDKLGAQDYIKTVYGIGYSWVNKDE